MRLDYLGDALDHFKGSLFRRLQDAAILRDLAADPMATDADKWTDDDYRLYSDLVGIQAPKVLKSQTTLDAKGRRNLGLPGHVGDLFLDPDTGIRTGAQSPVRSYVQLEEIRQLLFSPRVIGIYQHGWRESDPKYLESISDIVVSDSSDIVSTAYISKQAVILFFSRHSERISELTDFLHTWLGAKHQRVYKNT